MFEDGSVSTQGECHSTNHDVAPRSGAGQRSTCGAQLQSLGFPAAADEDLSDCRDAGGLQRLARASRLILSLNLPGFNLPTARLRDLCTA